MPNGDDSTRRAMDAAISDIEDALKHIVHAADHITLPQYRRLKKARHGLADFLVTVLKTDADAKPAGGA